MTYNVRTLSSHARFIELNEALREVKFDIIGLSETRRLGSKIIEYSEYILCYTGLQPGKYGVGFFVKKKHKENIESYTGITDRVALLNLNIQGYKISLIQVYAPTEAAKEEDVDSFYTDINRAIDQAHGVYLIMGDFNSKIGQMKPNEYLVRKSYGYGERNPRGQRLIEFALENKTAILNTYFKKKPNQRWTWRSPNGEYKNEIDFILSNRPSIVENVEVLNVNFSSDHRPIRATLTLQKFKKSRTSYKNFQNSNLKTEEEIATYRDCIISHLPDLLDPMEPPTVQKYHDKIIKAITCALRCGQSTSKNTKRKTHNVLSERTIKLMLRRRELQKTKNKTRSMKNELSALYKLVGKSIKFEYSQFRYNTLEKHLQTGSSKKAFKGLRTNKTWIEGLKNAGKSMLDRKDIITIASTFYQSLYNAREHENTSYEYNTADTTCTQSLDSTPPFDVNEIKTTIKRLKSDKCPGPDSISNEAIKIAQEQLALPLTQLFNLILESTETPIQWSESNIILIFKKGDSQDIANYRPISLLPCIYKLFSSLINSRISRTLEMNQPIEQAGFRKSFSTIDHIHTLELLMEKYNERQRALYIAYIDYKKAFDSISHYSIWKTLEEQGVERKYIQLIKNIYNTNTGRVRLEKIGPPFSIKRGVRQGDPLSPILFIAVLESIMRKLDWKSYGVNIDGHHLNHLRFADDLVLLSESGTQLSLMLRSLNEASKEVGLEMNLEKTMLMTNSREIEIYVDNELLPYTDKYIYLGKQLSFDRKNNELEIDRRTQNTWNKYWSLKEIFKSNMPVKLKTKVMSTCLLPCLTYACQTWKFTNNIKNKIVTCQRGLERSMLNINKRQKIRHSKIRSITKAKDALIHAQSLKWKWAGHVTRLQDDRWTRRITMWKGPRGKRVVGRPHTRWQDEIEKVAGSNWVQVAQDRDKWTLLEEAFTRGGVLT